MTLNVIYLQLAAKSTHTETQKGMCHTTKNERLEHKGVHISCKEYHLWNVCMYMRDCCSARSRRTAPDT